MKWYKKQLDQLKKSKAGPVVADEENDTKKISKNTFNLNKPIGKSHFPNPVAASNKNRPKTDSK
ncbi:MAG TPA: hypothetical protein VLK22_04235 [Candidatus Udaeobacter sp.]|nr:hypothetical protein [Candidatus Udaeobacter sp.]